MVFNLGCPLESLGEYFKIPLQTAPQTHSVRISGSALVFWNTAGDSKVWPEIRKTDLLEQSGIRINLNEKKKKAILGASFEKQVS